MTQRADGASCPQLKLGITVTLALVVAACGGSSSSVRGAGGSGEGGAADVGVGAGGTGDGGGGEGGGASTSSSATGGGGVGAIFDAAVVHEIAIEVDAGAWQTFMEEVALEDPPKTWRSAEITFDGTKLADVGFRTFGYGSRVTNPAKPNLRLDFNRYVPGQTLAGLKNLRLKNSGQDQSFLREPIVFEAMRAAGVLAPRTGWARVRVNGEEHGLYQVLEPVDKRFVLDRTGNDDGPGYKTLGCWSFAEPAGGCGALVQAYERPFNQSAGAGEDLAAVCQVVTSTPDAGYLAGLAGPMALDELVRYEAVNAFIADIDGLPAAANNTYFYRDTASDKLRVVASGVDLSLGNGDPLDVLAPWPAPWCPGYTERLLERLLAVPAGAALYVGHIQGTARALLETSAVAARVAELWAVIGPELATDPRLYGSFDEAVASRDLIVAFLAARHAEMDALFGPP
jgi:hypothetical protein